MENKFFRSVTDVLAIVFFPIGLAYLIVGSVFLTISIANDGLPTNFVDFSGDSMVTFSSIFLFVSFPFLILGLIFLIKGIKRRKLIKKLKENGTKIVADILSIERSYGVRMNGNNVSFLLCSAVIDGQKYVFKSEYLKASAFLASSYTHVPVYYNHENLKEYYVACNEIIGESIVYL